MNPAVLLLAGALLAPVMPTVEQFEAKLLHDTSGYRVSNGVPALQESAALSRAARSRADDLRTHYVSLDTYRRHIGSDGRPFYLHIEDYSPTAVGTTENLCRTVGAPADWVALNNVIDALQKSKTHNDSWLYKHYAYVGVGASIGPSGPYTQSLYVTQVFAVGFEELYQYNEVLFPKGN